MSFSAAYAADNVWNSNVAIGRTTTDAELHVNGGIMADGDLTANGSLTATALFLADGTELTGSASGYKLDADDGSPTDVVYVDSTGNVGVGTTSPVAKLHVEGDLTVSESLTVKSIFLEDGTQLTANESAGSYPAAQFLYKDADEIYINGGGYYLDGIGIVYWNSQLTFQFGSGGSNSDSTDLAATDWFYLYLDASEITSSGTIGQAQMVALTTEPSWSDTKRGWYNASGDLCVFAVYTDGSSNIREFYQESNVCYFADKILSENALDTDPGDWDQVTLDLPVFSNEAIASSAVDTYDSNKIISYRVNGSSVTTGHYIGGADAICMPVRVSTDDSGIIQLTSNNSNNSLIDWYTDAFILPIDMCGFGSGSGGGGSSSSSSGGGWVSSGEEVHNANAPTSWTDLNLSSVVGNNATMVMLLIENNGGSGQQFYFRTNGATESMNIYGASGASITNGDASTVIVETDASGLIEWYSTAAVTTAVTLMGYVLPGESTSFWSKAGDNLYYNNGNVGIGTGTPDAALEIQSDLSVGNSLTVSRGGMIVENGNVGIGTSAPSYEFSVTTSSPTEHVAFFYDNDDVGDATDGQGLFVHRRAAEGDNYLVLYMHEEQTGTIECDNNIRLDPSGDLYLEADPASYAYLVPSEGAGVFVGSSWMGEKQPFLAHYGYITAAASEKYVAWEIDDTTDSYKLSREDANIGYFDIQMPTVISGGNVGIGTTSPDATVEVEGDLSANGSLSAWAVFVDSGTMYIGGAGLSNNSGTLEWGGGSFNFGSGSADSFDITDSSANSDPTLNITNDTETWSITTAGSSSDNFEISRSGSGSIEFAIDTDGQVGIGMSNPSVRLDIAGTDSNYYQFDGANNGDVSTYTNMDANAGVISIVGTNHDAGLHLRETDGGIDWAMYVDNSDSDKLKFSNETTDHLTILANGNVGIAESTPTAKVEVNGDLSVGDALFVDQSTGNVGIGVTAPLDDLNIFDSVAALRLTDTDDNLHGRIRFDFGALLLDADVNNEGTSSNIRFGIDGDEKMRVDADGNVGIGTTSPEYKVDIVGTNFEIGSNRTNNTEKFSRFLTPVYNSDTVEPMATMFTNTANGQNIIRIGGGTGSGTSTSAATEVTVFTHSSVANSEGTARLHIQSDGNVGIGTTTPDDLLHLADTNYALRMSDTDGTATKQDFVWGFWNDALSLQAWDETGGFVREIAHFKHDGNIGIGTNNPLSALAIDVGGSGDQGTIEMRLGGNEATARDVIFRKNTSTPYNFDLIAGAHGTTGIPFNIYNYDGGSPSVTVDGNGNVGIGTTSPSWTLSVEDDIGQFIARYWNDGNSSTRTGVAILCGTDNASGVNRALAVYDGDSTFQGALDFTSGTLSLTPFTGAHIGRLSADNAETEYPYGTVMVVTSVERRPEAERQVLYYVKPCTEAYDPAVFGVYSNKYSDEENKYEIYAVGDGQILVCSEGGDIALGDYLVTSNLQGHAMKQDDNILRNWTVAKALEPVNWTEEESDTKLIACTYHAQ